MNFSPRISTVTILIQATITSYPDNRYAYLFAYVHDSSPNLSSTQETEYSSKTVSQIMLVSCVTELWLSFSWKKTKISYCDHLAPVHIFVLFHRFSLCHCHIE